MFIVAPRSKYRKKIRWVYGEAFSLWRK